jgi:hypothetical protein
MPWKNRVFFLDGLSKIGTADRGAVRGLQMANSDSAPDAEKFTEMIRARELADLGLGGCLNVWMFYFDNDSFIRAQSKFFANRFTIAIESGG